ncbi:MAG: hypothetical protein KTR30_37910 [Saprospiraceae bacterium]|nr:hypothetical protein [Saprospiraceae bacterium]
MLESHSIIQENEVFLQKHGSDLQANIFISRRKTFVEMLFLHLDENGDRTALNGVLSNLAKNSETARGIYLTSYENQLAIRTPNQHQRSLFCNLFLTSAGLSKIHQKDERWFPILDHLRGNRQDLEGNIPDLDAKFQGEKSIDAVMILGHNSRDAIPRIRRSLNSEIFPRIGVELLFVEEAQVYRNNLMGNNRERGLVVEHFGYADGASNPCITEREFGKFGATGKTMNEWNPVSSYREFVVPEPASPDQPSFGSYLVLRKMRQDVAKFNAVLKDVANKMNETKAEGESTVTSQEVGALTFGRRRNGTSLERGPAFDDKGLNDFHYPPESKCPFFAHARKMNQREVESSPGLPRMYQVPNPIIRRGITYGKRRLRYGSLDTTIEPSSEVGLFFMSFQKDIDRYQQILQNSWAGDLDPILGHLDDPNKTMEHEIPGLDGTYEGFGKFVDLLGGLNLFAPSLSFFKNLSTPEVI